MTRDTRFARTDDLSADMVGEGADSTEFRPLRSASSRAARSHLLPEDPIPIFLSNPSAPPTPQGRSEISHERQVSSRSLRMIVLAAAAAAVVLALISFENTHAIFTNAKASLGGPTATATVTTPRPSSVALIPAMQLTQVDPSTVPSVATSAGARTSSPVSATTPTRDEIATAFRTARQSQTEQAPTAAPPARRLDADELAALLKRAKSLIASGDIAPARLLLERAADAQEAGAALILAQTYDPAVLGAIDMRSITPDPVAARGWYQKAARLGSPEAQRRLAQIQN